MNILSFIARYLRGNPSETSADIVDVSSSADFDEAKDFESIGVFSVRAADKFLERLANAGVRFRIRCDTSAGNTGINGLYVERQRVEIFVHHDDLQKDIPKTIQKTSGLDS